MPENPNSLSRTPVKPVLVQMLDITTASMSPESLDWMNAHAGSRDGSLLSFDTEYGWIVHVRRQDLEEAATLEEARAVYSADEEDLNPPAGVINVLWFAAKLGCGWVNFDQDGEEVPDGLPEFDHG